MNMKTMFSDVVKASVRIFIVFFVLLTACQYPATIENSNSPELVDVSDKKFPLIYRDDTVRFNFPDTYYLDHHFTDFDIAVYFFRPKQDSNSVFVPFKDDKYIRVTLYKLLKKRELEKQHVFPDAYLDLAAFYVRCDSYIYDSYFYYKEFKNKYEYWIYLDVSETLLVSINSNDWPIENSIIDEIRDFRN